MGEKKSFQDELRGWGFSDTNSHHIACQAKRSSSHQIIGTFETSLKVASDEIYWYRITPQSKPLKDSIETQCCKHLSTVYIHMFERGRLNKILLQLGKLSIQKYLIQIFGVSVIDMQLPSIKYNSSILQAKVF
jgi:hypothetical protein